MKDVYAQYLIIKIRADGMIYTIANKVFLGGSIP